jgi:hypothetical protein
MPDGGSDNCASCTHFEHSEPLDEGDPEDWRCGLRDAQLRGSPYWTTCDDFRLKTTEPSGPMLAIAGFVQDGAISYVRLPYLKGHRPRAYQPGGGDTIIRIESEDGREREFDTPGAYLDFYNQEKK